MPVNARQFIRRMRGGAQAHLLYARGPASAPATMMEAEGYYVVMEGREVFKYAVRAMEDVTRKSVAGATSRETHARASNVFRSALPQDRL